MLHFIDYVFDINLTVLPDPPDLTVDGATGLINFSSPHHDGIQLDFYQVIIKDVTNQTIINIISFDNNITVNDTFHKAVCSPYIVTVEAHNTHGATNNSMSVLATNSDSVPGGNCNHPGLSILS